MLFNVERKKWFSLLFIKLLLNISLQIHIKFLFSSMPTKDSKSCFIKETYEESRYYSLACLTHPHLKEIN